MKKKKNEKRQVRVDVLDGVWAALWCRESPNICPGSLSVTNPADAHGWCFRSQAHITQRTGAAGPCLALLWQFSTLITSTSKNQAKGRIQGTILPCLHPPNTGTWRAGQGAIKPQHIICPACLVSDSSHFSTNWAHRNSEWAPEQNVYPVYQLPASKELPENINFLCCWEGADAARRAEAREDSNPPEGFQSSAQKFFFQLLCQEAQPGQGLTDISHPEHLYLYLSHVLCHLRHVSSLLQQNCQN